MPPFSYMCIIYMYKVVSWDQASLYQVADALLNDVDLRLYMHTAYGKGFMKNCRLSPDAYTQMALQLAYYRVSHPELETQVDGRAKHQ